MGTVWYTPLVSMHICMRFVCTVVHRYYKIYNVTYSIYNVHTQTYTLRVKYNIGVCISHFTNKFSVYFQIVLFYIQIILLFWDLYTVIAYVYTFPLNISGTRTLVTRSHFKLRKKLVYYTYLLVCLVSLTLGAIVLKRDLFINSTGLI